jgi:DNA-binding IscR family transcriptional regulator
LLWDAPIAPIPVAPTAVAVLQGFEDTTSLQKVAQTLGAPLEIVERIVKQLVSAGAMAGEVSE